MRYLTLISITLLVIAVGCSSGGAALQPQTPGGPAAGGDSDGIGRSIWGYWLLSVNADHTAVELLPVRGTEFHLNARRFLEESPCTTCVSIAGIHPSGYGTLLIDVQLRHPFLGETIYTGFDVRGVCIFKGSKQWPATGLAMSDKSLGDGQLMNPDGYTTLFNPVDYPPGSSQPMFEYQQGKFAGLTPDATLNGYKNFLTMENRHVFAAGGSDAKQYDIAMPEGEFVFGYVIDASWRLPSGSPPFSVPDDWAISANCLEAYAISAVAGSGLNPDGGSAAVDIQIYDWQGPQTIESVRVEAPDLFDSFIDASFQGVQGGFAMYQATISNDLGATTGSYDLLIEAKDVGIDPHTGDSKAYQVIKATVGGTPSGDIIIVPDEDGTFVLDDVYSFLCFQMGENTQPYWDEYSPALCQESDGNIRIVWVAPRLDYMHAADISVSSSDGGATWMGGGNMFGSLGSGPGAVTRTDTVKVAPDTEGDAHFILNFAINLVCMVDAGRCVEAGKNDYAFGAATRENDLETFVDSGGITIAFSDVGPGITLKHSILSNRLMPNEGGGSWDTSDYGPFTVTASGKISHVRSCDETLDGKVVLAYYSEDEKKIQLATSPADGQYSVWTPDVTIFEEPTGTVKDPCLQFDPNGGGHICFTRQDGGEYELCYIHTTGDLTTWSAPVVVATYSVPINDAHLLWDNEFSTDIVAFVYEAGGIVYGTLTADGGIEFNPPLTMSDMDTNVQDPDAVALQNIAGCDFITAWSYPSSWGYDDHDIRWRKAHFEKG